MNGKLSSLDLTVDTSNIVCVHSKKIRMEIQSQLQSHSKCFDKLIFKVFALVDNLTLKKQIL